jgi:hypothetical protein
MKADGTVTPVTPKNGKGFKLEELQGFVGGLIERTPPKKGAGRGDLWVNEEGLLLGLPYNLNATALAYPGAYLVGDAILVTGNKRPKQVRWFEVKIEHGCRTETQFVRAFTNLDVVAQFPEARTVKPRRVTGDYVNQTNPEFYRAFTASLVDGVARPYKVPYHP